MTVHGFKATAEWARGQWGERAVREWLRLHGYWLIPTADIENGGAPRAIAAIGKDPVLPDVLANRQGELKWVEVKTKEGPAFFQKFARYQHGVELRLWDDYNAVVSHFAPARGFLAVVELHRERDHQPGCGCEPLLLMGDFEEISKGMDRNSSEGVVRKFGEPMAFFDRGRFEIVGFNDDGPVLPSRFILPPRPRDEYVVHPWEKKRPAPSTNQQGYLL